MKHVTTFISVLLIPGFLYAWTGPSAAPPGNNVSAPVNVGAADQFKPGIMGANIINIYGASQYLSFGNTTGASGFGIRNNSGILEYKNSGGAWTAFGSFGGPIIGQYGARDVVKFFDSGTQTYFTIYTKIPWVGGSGYAAQVQLKGYGYGVNDFDTTISWYEYGAAFYGLGSVTKYQSAVGMRTPTRVRLGTWNDGGVNKIAIEVANDGAYWTSYVADVYMHYSMNTAYVTGWTTASGPFTGVITNIVDVPQVGLIKQNNGGRLDVSANAGNGGIISSGNYGGTGTAAYFPSGIWANGATSWLYGTRYVNGAEVDTAAGTIRDAGGGWVRTYGGTGWYNGTYGGGWYMADTTWIRAYNNKGIYTAGIVRGDQYVAGASFCDAGASYCSSAYGLWYLHTYYYSDKRLKKDIKDMSDDYGLGAIMKLRPVQFAWKDKTSSEKLGPQIGLIAQEVEQVIPEAVDTMPSKEITNADGTKETIENPKSVTYQNLVVPLIKAVQELKAISDAQQEEIEALKKEVERLQER